MAQMTFNYRHKQLPCRIGMALFAERVAERVKEGIDPQAGMERQHVNSLPRTQETQEARRNLDVLHTVPEAAIDLLARKQTRLDSALAEETIAEWIA